MDPTPRRSAPLVPVVIVPIRFQMEEAEAIQRAVEKLATNRSAFIRALVVREALRICADEPVAA